MTLKCDQVKNYDAFHKIISILDSKMIKYNLLFVVFNCYTFHNPVAGFPVLEADGALDNNAASCICAPALSAQKLFLST